MLHFSRLKTLARLALAGNTPVLKRSLRDWLLWHNHWGFEEGGEARVKAFMFAGIDWLRGAQAVWREGGVASRYDLLTRRFLPQYPETTGYLIPTLLNVAKECEDDGAADMAQRAAEWLLTKQMSDGSVECSSENSRGHSDAPATVVLFDCAAILQGFAATYRSSGDGKYADAADRLANFTVSRQLATGEWNTLLHFPYFGSHNALAGYALIDAGITLDRRRYVEAGIRCLDAIRPSILANGYIRKCHFTHDEDGNMAFLHPLAYTVEGFMKSSIALKDDEYLDVIRPTLRILQRRFEISRRLLASHYDEKWKPATGYSALDADCQVAMLWFQFSSVTGDLLYANSALKLMDLIRKVMDIETRDAGSRGGLTGSFPVHGDNQRYACVNWAPKYFVDASLLELGIRRRLSA